MLLAIWHLAKSVATSNAEENEELQPGHTDPSRGHDGHNSEMVPKDSYLSICLRLETILIERRESNETKVEVVNVRLRWNRRRVNKSNTAACRTSFTGSLESVDDRLRDPGNTSANCLHDMDVRPLLSGIVSKEIVAALRRPRRVPQFRSFVCKRIEDRILGSDRACDDGVKSSMTLRPLKLLSCDPPHVNHLREDLPKVAILV